MSTQLLRQQANPFTPQSPLDLGMSNADLLGALEGRFVAPLGPLSYFRGQQLPQQFWQGGIQPLPTPAPDPRLLAQQRFMPWMPGMNSSPGSGMGGGGGGVGGGGGFGSGGS